MLNNNSAVLRSFVDNGYEKKAQMKQGRINLKMKIYKHNNSK